MDDSPEFVLREICCTCLSRDRKLSQLCRLYEGINNLYLLLSYDTEAYREGFYKDTANWFICWECWAIMTRINKFRSQACRAQRLLADLVDGKSNLDTCFSQLRYLHKASIDIELTEQGSSDNFIDCGLDIKAESEEDDVPLSELSTLDNRTYTDDDMPSDTVQKDSLSSQKSKVKKGLNKTSHDFNDCKEYYRTVTMDEKEMVKSRIERKLATAYAELPYKCEFCIEGYKSETDLKDHNLQLHIEKLKHAQCDICNVFVAISELISHKKAHCEKYECGFCRHTSYNVVDMLGHLRSEHSINLEQGMKRKNKSPRKTVKPGYKPRRSHSMADKRTPFGYLCTECNKYFDNKNQRWKHIQKQHREGFKCGSCDKRFPFKNSLDRHEAIHKAHTDPPRREECAVCHKMVRVDLVKVHARIHTPRDRFKCVECDKCFVSRASYEHHLKYTQAHAAIDIRKYKCSVCDKGYRSRGELRDHVNYQHMGKTQHKCPICGKALATRRCITRHVRRAHDGVKESAKDKICQQCGKAFRDKKGLREHEFTHTGERPLSCEICGCTFRQNASLYTHRKRVHKIFPNTKHVTVVETTLPTT